jgi:hypothetical protein
LYKNFKNFSEERIKKGIRVKVIALGSGGNLRGLDERKWLKEEQENPTYIIIYDNKTAYISLNNRGKTFGVVIESDGVAGMQKLIFKNLFKTL